MQKIIKENKKYLIEYLLICIIGILFLVFYAISTSPITSNFWGSDSAFFQMVGRNLNHGLVMYKDIFDIKGPYLFLIEYLGYAAGLGRYGVFIIEIINLCIVLYYIYRSVELVTKKNRTQCLIWTCILFFFILACTLDCGNLSEEYALPYLFASLWMYLRYKVNDHIGNSAFWYGICFTLASLGRVTNSAFICVLVLDVIINLMLDKKWKELFKCAALFIGGVIISSMPFIIYFISQGALSDMFKAVFTFSFKYSVESTLYERICTMRWPLLIVFFMEILICLKMYRHECKKVIILLLNCFVMFMVLTLGNAYIHYYQILIPSMLLVFWMWWQYKEENTATNKGVIIFICVSIVVNLVYFVPYSGRVVAAVGVNSQKIADTSFGQFARKIEQLDSYGRGSYGYESQEKVNDIMSKIPENARNSVFNYETNPHWLLLSGLKPYSKYCITADHFSCLSDEIADDLQNMFENRSPQYVVTNTNVIIDNVNVKGNLQNSYRMIYQNKEYTLYQKLS